MMSEYEIIKTFPGKPDYILFENLPVKVYKKDSPRFIFGHNPAESHLEGCYVLLQDEEPAARFAFYENPELKYKGSRAACIGSYECMEELETGSRILQYAKELASSKKYEWLIGPMEGSTWNSYRFSDHNRHPNFFMEPYHHAYYNTHFRKSGFEPIAKYVSRIDESLEYDEEKIHQFEETAKKDGLTFRNIDLSNLETDLQKIARFSIKAFSGNFLYTPVTPGEFVNKYLRLEKLFNRELVWIIEGSGGEILALVFAIKDYSDRSENTVIIKSIARAPGASLRGVGSYLVGKIYQVARQQGFKKIIHPFMFQDNAPSLQISEKYSGKPYKSYTLYGLKL